MLGIDLLPQLPRMAPPRNDQSSRGSNALIREAKIADNERIVKEVLAAIGGKDNATSIAHCMTRLRINLKDEPAPDGDKIKAIKGALGCQ